MKKRIHKLYEQLLATPLRRFYERSAISFWKIDAKVWREAYQEQRGGEAFNEVQRQLAEVRLENMRLKSNTQSSSS